MRTCVVTRAELAKPELIRFVLDPEGRVVADLACRLPGRGAWVTCDKSVVAAALKTRAFNRTFKQQVEAPADLVDRIERGLAKRLCDALSLANKAGLAVAGHAKVEAMIAAQAAVVVLHGHDASNDGSDRIDRQFRAMARDAGRHPYVCRALSTEQLSLALGRSNVVHAALKAGGVTDFLLSEAARLTQFISGRPDTAVDSTADDTP